MTQYVNICQWSRSDGVLICNFLYNVAMKLLNTNHWQTATFRLQPLADSCFSGWKSRIRTHENLHFPCLAKAILRYFYLTPLTNTSETTKPVTLCVLTLFFQICLVNAGEAFDDDGASSEMTRFQSRVFPRRPLAVVLGANDHPRDST